ncbi:MAG: FAD-dependent oxidoreductase [Alphaproteobacteria bacterium]|nr:FAD-dependent oxidoreductase [Alphaproteobacteria bacterium]
MTVLTPHLCIIGGGSGGLSVAAGAAQMGADVVLFEGAHMGGDCLNYGCVPSKALLAAAKAAHYAHGHPEMGIKGQAPDVDFAAVKDHVEAVIKGIAPHDSPDRFRGLGVNVIEDYARFTAPDEVSGGGVTVRAKYFIVATGSSAFVPPIPGIDQTPYYTNETIFSDRTRPDHLVIIGGGPIGVEMAQAHARLGVKVTLIEAAPSIMVRDHPELVEQLKTRLRADGVHLIEGHGVTEVSGTTGQISVTVDGLGEIAGSHLLMAVGRVPNLERLDLDQAGIRYQRNGIITDARLRTSNKRVFAIGDAAGRQQFTHIAGYHAGIVVRNTLFRLPAKVDDAGVPWVTYTDPELAHVGLSRKAAEDKGIAAKEVEFSLAGNDRARAELRTEGKVIGVVDAKGRILGATILAPQAGEMIQPWILAISKKMKIAAMASYIAPYPTYGEASKRAAGAYFTPSLFSPRTRKIVRFLLSLPF